VAQTNDYLATTSEYQFVIAATKNFYVYVPENETVSEPSVVSES